jgi:hypothetical protein
MSETNEATPEAPKPVLTPEQAAEAAFQEAVVVAKKANPGTEIWEYRHPRVAVRVAYRGMTSSEARVYTKKLTEQQARGDLGDVTLAYDHVIFAAVVVPEKPQLIAMLVSFPMAKSAIVGEICEATGFDADAKSKKL